MKIKYSLLAVLMLFSTGIFAQNRAVNTNKDTKHEFLKNRHKQSEVGGKHIPAFYVKAHQGQLPGLKTAAVIKQRLDSTAWKDWDAAYSQWIDSYKESFVYDAVGHNTLYSEFDWDMDSGEWIPYSKDNYEYDASGNMAQEIDNYWDEMSEDWIPYWKTENTFNSNGTISQTLEYEWDVDVSEWLLQYKEEYSYDVNGNVLLSYQYEWDDYSNLWFYSSKIEYTYDANGRMLQALGYYWDYDTSEWVTYYKDECAYDAYGNLITYTEFEWDIMGSLWVGSWKDEYTYDGNGNITLELEYYWDEYSHDWIADYQEDYSYNNSYTFADLVLPYVAGNEVGLFFNHMLTNIDESLWDDGSSLWIDNAKGVFYYSPHDYTAINDAAAGSLVISPNPASDYFTIRFSGNWSKAHVELSDIYGRKVFTNEAAKNEKISMQGLRSGIYFYNITIDGNRYSGRLVKE